MQIKNLAGLPSSVLAECLNLAFADYLIPMYVSEAALNRKRKRENIDPEWSVGLFDGDTLAGFILHGVGEKDGRKVLYNGGTGILPAYRGQGYTQRMYRYLEPQMRKEDVKAVWLEVIDRNERAMQVYQKIGFQRVRIVDCLRGEISGKRAAPPRPHWQIETIREPVWAELAALFDYPPTWQNDVPALRNALPDSVVIGVHQGEFYLGYLLYNLHNHRLDTLAVHPLYRRQGLGTALLQQLPPGVWSAINIDRRNKTLLGFLQGMGWERVFSQWEMVLMI